MAKEITKQMKTKTVLPKWAKWTIGIVVPVVIIGIVLGAVLGTLFNGGDKETAFTYTFTEDFEGYHKGTKVDVRNNGTEAFTSQGGQTEGLEKGDDGYIKFKHKKPVSVKGYDGKIVKVLKPGESMDTDRWGHTMTNNTDHDITVYGTQSWNSNNIYKANIDKYTK